MVNDVILITTIFATFLLLGAVLPFINQEFAEPSINQSVNTNEIISSAQVVAQTDSISSWEVITSMTKIFFFTFGDLPYLLDVLLFIPRIIFALLIYRQVRSGGG